MQDPRRRLPAVDQVLGHAALRPVLAEHGRARVLQWVRDGIAHVRESIEVTDGRPDREELAGQVAGMVVEWAGREATARFGPVINATGVILHTNLGRAPLADRAIEAARQGARYGNLETDLATGQRRYRGYQLDDLWRRLTGAEASLVVNNCAAATLLALRALAQDREVVVSRGQLIEIGGSYRLPDVFRESGAVLREVGTTNRTRIGDYAAAVNERTAALLLVHTSNYRVVGFTESVEIDALAELGRRDDVPVIHDVGSGALIDLAPFGLPDEPIVPHSIAAGADLVLFSGDKLLGGPQCGVLLGKAEVIETIRRSPLARALRIDKSTLAALGATLEIYSAERHLEEIPVLRQLSLDADELARRTHRLLDEVRRADGRLSFEVRAGVSAVGGGSAPGIELPTWTLALTAGDRSVDELAHRLRTEPPRVIARVEQGAVILDLRTVFPDEEASLAQALRGLG